ncbi:MAG TPA: hypothetical protein VFV11_01565, partial [Solimonas sp.]|nr:hypothetical protein [Solimonas sp.]
FAQTLVDSGDPLNYAQAAAANHPLLMFEVVGDGVVPNCAVAGNPACPAIDTLPLSGYLSGSDPLARALGLEFVPGPTQGDGLDVPAAASVTGSPTGPALHAVVRFNQGDHGSILSPAANALVTCEMQRQAAAFVATNGRVLSIAGCAP